MGPLDEHGMLGYLKKTRNTSDSTTESILCFNASVKTTRRVRRPKIHDEGDVDIDVDIETIDDSYVDLEPETEVVKPKRSEYL